MNFNELPYYFSTKFDEEPTKHPLFVDEPVKIRTFSSKQAPGVRDAFSEAFGAKNRRFRYRRDIRSAEQPSVVRGAFSEAFGVKNRLLRYGRDIRYQKPPFLGFFVKFRAKIIG